MTDAQKRLKSAQQRAERRQAAYENSKKKHLPDEVKRMHRYAHTKKTIAALKKAIKNQHGSSTAHMPPIVATIPSPCKSSRGGVQPHIIVLHETVSANVPGAQDVKNVGTFFSYVSTQASSNVVGDAEGNVVRCVADSDKAWAQAAYNPGALSYEQVGRPGDFGSPEAWKKEYAKGLEAVAQTIAYWSVTYDIPLVHSTTHGVCQHVDLGAAGGGHVDVGDGYPFDFVLSRAKAIKASWGH